MLSIRPSRASAAAASSSRSSLREHRAQSRPAWSERVDDTEGSGNTVGLERAGDLLSGIHEHLGQRGVGELALAVALPAVRRPHARLVRVAHLPSAPGSFCIEAANSDGVSVAASRVGNSSEMTPLSHAVVEAPTTLQNEHAVFGASLAGLLFKPLLNSAAPSEATAGRPSSSARARPRQRGRTSRAAPGPTALCTHAGCAATAAPPPEEARVKHVRRCSRMHHDGGNTAIRAAGSVAR